MDYKWEAVASKADLRHDFRLSATIYSLEFLQSEGGNPAIFYYTGSRVRFDERIHRTWNGLTGIRFTTPIRSCIPESTEMDNRKTSQSFYPRAWPWSSIPKKIWQTIHPRKFGYDVTVRTSVRTLWVEVSRNEFLPSPLESFVPYCFKRL